MRAAIAGDDARAAARWLAAARELRDSDRSVSFERALLARAGRLRRRCELRDAAFVTARVVTLAESTATAAAAMDLIATAWHRLPRPV